MAKVSPFCGLFPFAIFVDAAIHFHDMVAEWLQKLLILQDRDSRCDGIQRQLEGIPGEISAEEGNIKNLQDNLSKLEQEARGLEVKRLDLEGEVELTEASIVKYKTQQMQVKKNEEYTALQNEINALEQKISDLEDAELEILEEIDSKAAELANVRKDIGQQQKTLEAHIALLRQNYDSFAAELEDARNAVSDCERDLDPGVLQQYKYVKSQLKRPPVVVALEDSRCLGCHLKVSGEVESEARKGNQLIRCDSCGRILYFDR